MLDLLFVFQQKSLGKTWGIPETHTASSVNCCVWIAATASALFIPCLACLARENKVLSYLKESCAEFLSRLLHCVFWSHSSSKCIPLVHLLQGIPSPVWGRWELHSRGSWKAAVCWLCLRWSRRGISLRNEFPWWKQLLLVAIVCWQAFCSPCQKFDEKFKLVVEI